MFSCCFCCGETPGNIVGCVDLTPDNLEELASAYEVPPNTFVVHLKRRPSCVVGLDVDRLDQQNLMVLKTQPGLVSEYNKTAPQEQVIRKGDRIRKVNGKSGRADELLAYLTLEGKLDLEVQHCQEYEFHIEKKGKTLGLQLAVTEKASCLTVERVEPHGVIARLNEAHDHKIQAHDKIMAVDGTHGLAPELMKQIKEKDSFKLKVLSWE
ncbi:unnamed protein product [Effrenium voratum]|nr:unnamed protein product [Effrenium voratum]